MAAWRGSDQSSTFFLLIRRQRVGLIALSQVVHAGFVVVAEDDIQKIAGHGNRESTALIAEDARQNGNLA
jgi:hypothetical protein